MIFHAILKKNEICHEVPFGFLGTGLSPGPCWCLRVTLSLGPCLHLWSDCSQGLCWSPWPMLPLRAVSHLSPCWWLRAILQLRPFIFEWLYFSDIMVMFMPELELRAISGSMELLQPGSVLIQKVSVAIESQVDFWDLGPCYCSRITIPLGPCLSEWAYSATWSYRDIQT